MTALAFTLIVAAQPVSLYVANLEVGGEAAPSGAIYAQALATELRRWGIRVTTQSDLEALLAGKRQEQIMGCEDHDCGLDPEVIKNADGMLTGTVSIGGDDAVFSLKIIKNRGGTLFAPNWSTATGTASKADVMGGLIELVPQLVADLRTGLGADRVAAAPLKDRPAPPPAPRRCDTTGGALALAAVLAALRASASSRSSAQARSRPRSAA
jgi:hypothetical protein